MSLKRQSLEHSADKRNKIMSRLKSIDGDRQHIELQMERKLVTSNHKVLQAISNRQRVYSSYMDRRQKLTDLTTKRRELLQKQFNKELDLVNRDSKMRHSAAMEQVGKFNTIRKESIKDWRQFAFDRQEPLKLGEVEKDLFAREKLVRNRLKSAAMHTRNRKELIRDKIEIKQEKNTKKAEVIESVQRNQRSIEDAKLADVYSRLKVKKEKVQKSRQRNLAAMAFKTELRQHKEEQIRESIEQHRRAILAKKVRLVDQLQLSQ